MSFEKYYQEFSLILASEDKEAALNYALDLLKEQKLALVVHPILGPH
jgi:hypothetical protein